MDAFFKEIAPGVQELIPKKVVAMREVYSCYMVPIRFPYLTLLLDFGALTYYFGFRVQG